VNLLVGAPSWLLIVLGCALAAAAIEDAARLRISNIISFVVLLGGVVAAILIGHGPLWKNVVTFAAVLAMGTAAFGAGWLGGGDVKLLAAFAAWLDFASALWFLALVFLAGGLVAIVYLSIRSLKGWSNKDARRARVPYGIAIAVGAFALLLITRGSGAGERPLPAIHLVKQQPYHSAANLHGHIHPLQGSLRRSLRA
jgi:prepilin peptidase CpaA